MALPLLIGSCSQQKGNSAAEQQAVVDSNEGAESAPIVNKPQPVNVDFIQGGKTYTGKEVKDNAGYEMNEHSETEYEIQCFKDGTMKWHEKHYFHTEYENEYEGKWKKNSGSKYDNAYTWYEFWATTYDMYGNDRYKMIGFVDDKGNLYTMFSVEDPIMSIHDDKSVCKLSAQ